MIFPRKGVEHPEIVEKLEELSTESADLLRENAELRQDRYDLEERLSVAESFSGASEELFRQFNDHLRTMAFISLSVEAKAIWYPVFENALTQLLGEEGTNEANRIIDTSTFGQLLEYTAEANPTVQATVSMLTDEVFQKSQRDAQERVTRLLVMRAESDATLRLPVLVEEMYAEYSQSAEGKEIYEEAYRRKLGELAIVNREEITERLTHQAYADATQAHLDSEAARIERKLLIEAAREDFFKKGINLSQLPTDTEVTIWLGTDQEYSDLHKKQIIVTDRTMMYRRKLRAFKMGDRYDGFDIYEDVIDASPTDGPGTVSRKEAEIESRKRLINALVEAAMTDDTFEKAKRKKKSKKIGVMYDDTTSLEGRHLLGQSKKDYADSGRQLERFVAAGKPLAYDGDPRNPEHKSTTLVVLNVALNGEPVVEFKDDLPYSRRDELQQAKAPRRLFGW